MDIAQYAGAYRTTVEYTITPKLPTDPNNPTNPDNPNTPNDPNKPYALDPTLNIRTDYDKNMIPIKYTGTGSSGWVKADPNNTNGDWFNYSEKKWANVVTINTIDNVTKYQQAPIGTPIDNDDIKGFWVYIPRYAYEVMRRDAVDKVVQPQNFDIKFETTKDIKKTPKPCDSTTTNHKDYRTECGIDRTYPGNNIQNKDNTTWATHPAFTWGDEELNGFWMAKFELTGPRTAPTVLPNKVSNANEYIGSFYNIIKSIGVEDPENTGGGCTESHNCLSTITQYNQHNLNKSSSYMLKNSEWGATAYLSASQYGAGVNKVQGNTANGYGANLRDEDGDSGVGVTGCGPQADGDKYSYYVVDLATTPCGNTSHQYTGSLGQLASTTNNVYGVYDMVGGNQDYLSSFIEGRELYVSGMIMIMPAGKYIDIYPKDIELNNVWQYSGGHGWYEVFSEQNVAWRMMWGHSRYDLEYAWVFRGAFENGGEVSVFSWGSFYSVPLGITARAALIVDSN